MSGFNPTRHIYDQFLEQLALMPAISLQRQIMYYESVANTSTPLCPLKQSLPIKKLYYSYRLQTLNTV